MSVSMHQPVRNKLSVLPLIVLLLISLAACNGNGNSQDRRQSQPEIQTEAPSSEQEDENPLPEVSRMGQFNTSEDYAAFGDEGMERWEEEIPQVADISIRSTADGQEERALFYDSGSEQEKPLLVVLHSWSSGYQQIIGIPYAQWAREHDWVFIHPNFRGEFDNPEATGSDLAIQDIVDAVNYAKENARVDASRVYVSGFSGGGMLALSVAARHPHIWAGVVAWVPVTDLVDWYEYNQQRPDRPYDEQIAASCGGALQDGNEAVQECMERSPVAHLSQSLEVPVYIAHGINDDLVPVSHSIRAFNLLANEQDRISEEQIDYMVAENQLPEGLEATSQDTYFADEEPEVLFIRESNNARLVLFEGEHNMVYNPGLLWLSEQKR